MKSDAKTATPPQGDTATPAMREASGLRQAFRALAITDFRTLWFGSLFNIASMQINIVSRSWMAYELSGSALVLGLVAMARGLPQLLFGPLGGVAADRFDKRKVLVVSQSLLCVFALINALLVQTGVIQVWHLVVIGLMQGTVFPFTMPTRQAFIPQLAGKEALPNALALDSAGRNLNRVVAPSIAGLLLAFNPVLAFYAVAFFYFLSAATLFWLPAATSPGDRSRNAFQQLVFGFSYIVQRRRLLILIGLAFIAVTLGMPYQQMLPVFQKSVLNVGPEKLGFMYAAVGGGALIGSLGIAYRSDDPRRQTYQLIAGVLFGVLLVPFALSPNLYLSLALLAMIGFCNEIFMTVNRMMVLLNTDSRFYGRVMGTYAMTFSLMPIATLPMGALVDVFGARGTVAGAGCLLFFVVIGAAIMLPRLWNKDTTATVPA